MTTTTTVDPELRARFRFFHAHAGWVVGERAIGALALARADRALRAGIREGCLRIETVEDPDGTSYGEYPAWTIALAYVRSDDTSDYVASVGGVDDPWGTYGDVLAAELALEVGLGRRA